MLTIALLVLCAQAATMPKLPVFVTSPAAVNGFTDPDQHRQDSIKDLTDKLKDAKRLRAVTTPEDAVILVEVLARETRREVNIWGAQNKSVLLVRVTAGDYSTEMTGESGSKGVMSGYGDAAKKVVKQLDEWALANKDKLASLTKQ